MNLRFWQKRELYGATIPAGHGSLVSGYSYPYVQPEVDFASCYDYYRTIGKVQNAVESYVSEVLSRDWYYQGEQAGVKALEEWEERFDLSRLIEYVVRDWLVCGNSIISTSDWQPVQMSSVVGMKRSPYGITEQFVQQVNGQEVMLDTNLGNFYQYARPDVTETGVLEQLYGVDIVIADQVKAQDNTTNDTYRNVLAVKGVAFGLASAREVAMEAQRRNELQQLIISGTHRIKSVVLDETASCRISSAQ